MKLGWFGLLALAWIGCGGAASTMPQGLRDDVTSLRLESQQHYSNILAMSAMGGVADEDARHMQKVADIMGTMRNTMGGMSCNDMMSMRGMMDGMDTMMSQYAAAMASAISIDEAKQLTSSHRDDMNQLCDEMDSTAMSMRCSMMN